MTLDGLLLSPPVALALVTGGIDGTIPVDVYVPGCSVRPEALIRAVEDLIDKRAALQKEKEAEQDGSGE